LQSELKTTLEQGSGKNKGKTSMKPILPARKLRDLKLAFSEFYLSLILLQNYQNLNHTGFRKILKKHDKVFALQNNVIQLLVTLCMLIIACNFRDNYNYSISLPLYVF